MTRNNADFHGIDLNDVSFSISKGEDIWDRTHTYVDANHDVLGQIGQLHLKGLQRGGRTVSFIHVDHRFRRQGIGTALFRHAEEQGLRPRMSNVRTDDGEKFGQSLGVELPENKIK
jgi:ribosomal protein S18 acetylase RimI-like enzyme